MDMSVVSASRISMTLKKVISSKDLRSEK
jgi:hypothetical protein